jgi:hypothetical protein
MEKSKNLMQVDHPGEPKQVDESRRRWTKAGLGAGAVLATLAGRPAFAGICQSPSAFSSGNMSHHSTAKTYTGRSPDSWAGVVGGHLPVNPKFHDIFPSGAQANWGQKTFEQVLDNETNGLTPGLQPSPISQEFVAAYLNWKKDGSLACLDDTLLVMMWNDYVGDGLYEVRANVFWDAGHIVTYLQNMRTPPVVTPL